MELLAKATWILALTALAAPELFWVCGGLLLATHFGVSCWLLRDLDRRYRE